MATSTRGRSGSGSGATSGRSTWQGAQSSYGGWSSTGGSGEHTTARKTKSTRSPRTGSSGYKSCETSFAEKVQSFKMLWNQTKCSGKYNRPTPAMLNSFANWVNKGGVIQCVSSTQVARWAKAVNKNFNSRTATPTTCKTVLCSKFGKSAIKNVVRTKTGGYMVATPARVNGKRFCFPNK